MTNDGPSPSRSILVLLSLSLTLGLSGCGPSSPSADSAAEKTKSTARHSVGRDIDVEDGDDMPVGQPAPTTPSTPIKTTSSPAPTGTAAAGGGSGPARLAVDMEYNFGEVWDAEEHVGFIKLSNPGGEPLTIEKVKPTCGCTKVKLEQEQLGPGESTQMEITYKPKGTGPQRTYINMSTSAEPGENVRLTVRSHVLASITVEPKPIRLGQVNLNELPRTVPITISSRDPEMTVLEVKPSGSGLSARHLGPSSSEAGAHLIEAVVGTEAAWGDWIGSVAVTCKGRLLPHKDEVVEHTVKIGLRGSMFGELSADKTRFVIGYVERGASFEQTIRLIRQDPTPFQVLATDVTFTTMEGVQFRAEPIEDGENGYLLILSGEPGSHRGSINGQVLIKTDVPGETEIRLRFQGAAR